MASRFFDPRPQITNSTNALLANGTLTFYLSETLTLGPVYLNRALSDAAQNPCPIGSDARVPALWLDSAITYRVVCKNSDGVVLWDEDPYRGVPSSLDGADGASTIGTANGETVQERLDGADAAIAQETADRIAADALKADDANVVHKAGDESITGVKTFTVPPVSTAMATLPTQVPNLQQYVGLVGSLSYRTSAKASTTAALPANAYSNGASGVGATLTGSVNGALAAQDGTTLVLNDRLWVRHEAAPARNGLYALTQVGNAGAPYILTRVTDSDVAAELAFATSQVETGTLYAGYQFTIPLAAGSITVGTTDLTPVITGLPYQLQRILALEAILQTITPAGFQLAFMDNNGFAAAGIKDDGTLAAARSEITTLVVTTFNGIAAAAIALAASLVEDKTSGLALGFRDANGFDAAGLKDDGTLLASRAEMAAVTATTINGRPGQAYVTQNFYAGNYEAEISMRFSYGQSNGEGEHTSEAQLVVTTVAEYDNKMFNSGVRTQDGGGSHASMVPLVESSTSTRGETPVAGALSMMKQAILEQNGIAYTAQSYTLLGSAPAQGGLTAAQLSKPSVYYTRVLGDVQGGYDLALAAVKTFNVPAYYMTQMEADYNAETAVATWWSTRSTLHTNLDADIRAITGQANTVREFCGQTASHLTYYAGGAKPTARFARLAQKLLDESNNPANNLYIACPMYHLPYNVDGIHLTAVGARWYGAYLGLLDKRVNIDGNSTWKPVQITSAVRSGSIITLTFNVPRPPLVLDTTQVSAIANSGIQLYNSADVEQTISSATLIGPSKIKLVTASPAAAGDKVRIAMSGTGGGTTGPVNGARSNIRDSQGDDITFLAGGQRKRMDNWACIQELTLT